MFLVWHGKSLVKCCRVPPAYYLDYTSCLYKPTRDQFWEYYDDIKHLVFCPTGYVVTGIGKKINPWDTDYHIEWIQCCRVGFSMVGLTIPRPMMPVRLKFEQEIPYRLASSPAGYRIWTKRILEIFHQSNCQTRVSRNSQLGFFNLIILKMLQKRGCFGVFLIPAEESVILRYRICRNKRPLRYKRPPKTVIFQRGEYTKPMAFDGWFFKGESTQNRWLLMGDFSKGRVHKTDGFWWVIFQRGEYTKPMAFDRFRDPS